MQSKRLKPLLTRKIEAGMLMKGYKPHDMEKAFGVSDRQWRNWMNNPAHHLTVYRLSIIATMLNTTASELIREEV